jgi:hypothetical protein
VGSEIGRFLMVFAYFLIIVGVVFLLRNLGLLPVGAWDVIWPSLLIVWGLSMILGRSKAWWWGWHHGRSGSVKEP